MSNDINKVILIGRLTKDPELKYTQSGSSVCSFSIANNKTWTQNGEKKDQVSFFNCIAWGKLGELIAQYCRQGNRVCIEGRLQQRSWDDQEGKKRSTVEIVVSEIQFLTPKTEHESSYTPPVDNNTLDSDDIPF